MRSKIKKFENKVVIITGASSGLGRQLSEDFAINNAKVVLVARSTEKLLKLEKEIQALASDTLVITADITKPGDISKIKDLTLEKFGRIDILVNNAGIEKMARFEDLKPEDIAELTQTNFTGPVTLMNKILPVML
ncbi:MAG: SDR family oxidoreductase, partial [Candidatus Heimdallarchaeota archaeon]|nr:SDR family oxidoreductase [Candidatus Heimdallarchaeota archaeon]